jgi:hypothetical protein
MLPLLAVALSVPVIAAFGLAGPGAGLAMGALAAGAIVVFAARAQFDHDIEVAPADGRWHVLVVAMEAIEEPAMAEAIADAVGADGDDSAEVLVMAPALNTPLSHWLSDLRRARLRAQQRLAVSLAVLAAAGVDARGQVGDTDPVQATEDVLRGFPASEVLYVTGGRAGARAAAEVRRRLDRPVRDVEAELTAVG